MSKVRVCFLGTTDFSVSCLKALLDDEHYEVVGVVTQPDRPAGRKLQLTPTPVKALADSLGLRVVAPESLKQNPLIVEEIRRWGAEIGVVVAFGQILTQDFMSSFNFGCVNVHASLLPLWRGAAPIQRSIEAGDKESGVSLQRMVKKLDAGDVIAERKMALDDEINSLQLHDALAFLGADLLRVELMDFIRGNLAAHPQDESKVTYAKKIEKTESLLEWSQSAQKLHDKVRAFVWGPGTYTMLGGKRLKVHKTRVADGRGAAGSVLKASEGRWIIACGEGALELLEVQPESRSRLTAAEFLKSQAVKEGDRL